MAEFIWNNMAYNSEDEMNLAKEIPGVYLDRWNDAGYVAEAVIGSDWLAALICREREAALIEWADFQEKALSDFDYAADHEDRAEAGRWIKAARSYARTHYRVESEGADHA